MLKKEDYPITSERFRQLNGGNVPPDPKEPFTPLEHVSPQSETLKVMPHLETEKKYPERTQSDTSPFENAKDLVDLMLVGKDEKGRPEIHLSLKDNVAEGMYIKLQKREEGGYHALFVAPTYSVRNQVSPHIDGLIKHLKAKGSKIISHEIIVGKTMPDVNLS